MVATLLCPVGEGRKSVTCNIAVYRDMDSTNDCLINLLPWIRHHAVEMVGKVYIWDLLVAYWLFHRTLWTRWPMTLGVSSLYSNNFMPSISTPDSTSSVLHAYTRWDFSQEHDPLVSGIHSIFRCTYFTTLIALETTDPQISFVIAWFHKLTAWLIILGVSKNETSLPTNCFTNTNFYGWWLNFLFLSVSLLT